MRGNYFGIHMGRAAIHPPDGPDVKFDADARHPKATAMGWGTRRVMSQELW